MDIFKAYSILSPKLNKNLTLRAEILNLEDPLKVHI